MSNFTLSSLPSGSQPYCCYLKWRLRKWGRKAWIQKDKVGHTGHRTGCYPSVLLSLRFCPVSGPVKSSVPASQWGWQFTSYLSAPLWHSQAPPLPTLCLHRDSLGGYGKQAAPVPELHGGETEAAMCGSWALSIVIGGNCSKAIPGVVLELRGTP